ncbi:hypothetical protein ACJX0J_019589, partial [Zea mays]
NFIGYVGKHKGSVFFLHLYKDIRSPQIQRTLIFTATILLAIDISEIYVNDLYAKDQMHNLRHYLGKQKLFINVFNSWQYEKSGLLDGLLELGGAGVMESTFSSIEIEAIILIRLQRQIVDGWSAGACFMVIFYFIDVTLLATHHIGTWVWYLMPPFMNSCLYVGLFTTGI